MLLNLLLFACLQTELSVLEAFPQEEDQLCSQIEEKIFIECPLICQGFHPNRVTICFQFSSLMMGLEVAIHFRQFD